MAFAFMQDVPINADVYEKIVEGLGRDLPEGMLCHTAFKTENGLRYIDVWESRDAWSAFVESRLHPVVFSILKAANLQPAEEPPIVELEVVDLWK